ncbi:MAG TPA: hypothetical protein VMF69_01015 [Gemmataceae bacterium]|nr:hypothetical protein [Gemmataceae bacterium]
MDLQDPWDDYAHLQQQADRRKIDAKSWTAEEQANEFLAAIADKTLKSALDARGTRMENLGTNRAKKHRRRAALMHDYRFNRPIVAFSKAHGLAVLNEDISQVQQQTSSEEWRMLWALANGDDYKTVAKAIGCTMAALKTRVSRCRRRLLHACG